MSTTVRTARKHPIDVEFMAWPGGASAATPVIDWILEHGGTARWSEEYTGGEEPELLIIPECLAIEAPHETLYAHPGDVILRGPDGSFRPMRADEFGATYEILEDAS